MKRKLIFIIVTIVFIFIPLTGCNSDEIKEIKENKGGIFYEIFVSSFKDSNNDSIGDLNGITEELPYLNYLGIGGIWLTPINQSTTYHKYDVSDYYTIDDDFGDLQDLENLVSEAKLYNIDIIMDLVLNHTSSNHEWFIKALEEVKTLPQDEWKYANYYNFEVTTSSAYTKVEGTIYSYESRFWSEMPDLNLDNETVYKELLDVAKFYIDLGIYGFRLDATAHFFNENHDKNIDFLTKFNNDLVEYKEDIFMVQEVWQNQTTTNMYYESNIFPFNFGYSDTLGGFATAVRTQDATKLGANVEYYNNLIRETNEEAIDRIFITNHDQGRCAGYFGSTNDKTKVLANLLMSTPGVPFVYYGEELGMRGNGIDENKRLGFVWSSSNTKLNCDDPTYATFKQTESFKGQIEQEKDKNSIYNHYVNLLDIRNKYYTITTANPKNIENDEGLYILEYSGEQNFIIINNVKDSEVIYEIDGYEIVDSLSINNKGKMIGNTLYIASYELVILQKK